MAKIVPSPFCGIEFSGQEELWQSQILLHSQRQWIQYLISLSAMERLALTYDPSQPLVFAQQEAELKGKIGILQHLLDCSDSATESLKTPPTSTL